MKSGKILFILHYPPPTHGAALVGKYIMESVVINSTFNTKYINLGTSRTIEEIGRGGLKKFGRYIFLLLRTFWQGLTWRPDLVYITLNSHGSGLVKDSLLVAICQLLHLPHVFHFHNKGVKSFAQTFIGKTIYKLVFKKAKVILLSPLLYDDIADLVPASDVYYCANGIPDLFLEKNLKHEVIENGESPIQVLFLSNLIESKGVQDLLQACDILSKNGFAFQCIIVGGEANLKRDAILGFIKENSLHGKVSYLGKADEIQKNTILSQSHLLIHPTREDCFPLVLLEAMQFSLPIITTSEGAIPELVIDGLNGFIVPKKSPQAIAAKVAFYLENRDLLNQHGHVGRKMFEKNYNLSSFEERMLRILKEIIGI